MINSSQLLQSQVEALLSILRLYKRALGWSIADIIWIPLGICTHNIKLEENDIPSTYHQRRFNPPMQEVVRNEIFKWFDMGVVYPIADSKSVSLVQRIPMKGVLLW